VRQTPEFAAWLAGVSDPIAQRAIAMRLVRFEGGLFGDVKVVGDKVSEARIDVGQGYRAYFTVKGRTIVFMLCGGDKSTQKKDIKKAEKMVPDLE